MRLNKFLAHAGVDSRRNCDDHIFDGKVTINGEVVDHPGHQVDPEKDDVRFKGELVSLENKVYYRYHKPVGQASTTEDPNIDNTLEDVVNQVDHRIYPVGRLDQDSRGLLLLTNDGDLTHVISHPSHGITKEYEVMLNRPVQEEDLNRLRSGQIELDGRAVHPEEIITTGERKVSIKLIEGRNRQIRRMFDRVGYDVDDLYRIRIGPITINGIPEGKLEKLSSEKVNELTNLLGN
jgi:23S rRNA pseudouridine2605 synthase